MLSPNSCGIYLNVGQGLCKDVLTYPPFLASVCRFPIIGTGSVRRYRHRSLAYFPPTGRPLPKNFHRKFSLRSVLSRKTSPALAEQALRLANRLYQLACMGLSPAEINWYLRYQMPMLGAHITLEYSGRFQVTMKISIIKKFGISLKRTAPNARRLQAESRYKPG